MWPVIAVEVGSTDGNKLAIVHACVDVRTLWSPNSASLCTSLRMESQSGQNSVSKPDP